MRTRSGLFLILGVLGLTLLLGAVASSQTELRRGRAEAGPTFYADAIAYSSDQSQKSRLEVYVQVPHDEIRFIKEGDQYMGRYELTLSIFTPTKQLTHEETWSVDIPVTDFAQTTQNKLYSLTHRTVDVDPGNYQMTIQLRDQESRKSSQIRRSILISDFSKDSLSLSDIMLVNRLSTEGAKRTIVPNISGSISSLAEGFFVFFEMYSKPTFDSADVSYKIFDSKKNEVVSRTEKWQATGHKTQVFLKIDSTGLHMGTYFIAIEATAAIDSAGQKVIVKGTTSRTFSIRAIEFPVAIVDLDKAVEQLIYIARESEMEYIRSAPNEEEKRKRFLEFWSKRDPDPQTHRNELMEEYYARIQYANQNFTHYLEGWRSDMGMVYIRFGTPDNIERHPFENYSRPYEIWYYYQLNRQFIFVDETGFGDYRLRYPTTDLWGRVR